MTHWLYPANIQYYDVLGAFAEETTYWPVKSRVAVGDKIYIYLAAPFKQIAFVSEIVQTDLTQNAIYNDIKPFFKQPPENKGDEKPFMQLTKIQRLAINEDSPLNLSKLRVHGLKGMLMGPRNLGKCTELYNYVKGHLA